MLTPPPRCKMNRVDDLTIDYLTRSRDCRDFFFIIFFLHFSLSRKKKINKKFARTYARNGERWILYFSTAGTWNEGVRKRTKSNRILRNLSFVPFTLWKL